MMTERIKPVKKLRITFCPPELHPFQSAMRGEPTNAAYLLLSHIAKRLLSRGHQLTFITQRDLGDYVCTTDLDNPISAPLTWSNNLPFELLRKAVWKIQKFLGIPYLNIFNNLRLYDACLQCLPGHDLVYERNGLYRNGVAMACRQLKMPYVLFVDADEILEHDYMAQPIKGLLRGNAKRQFLSNMEKADCIICVSEHSKSHLVNKWQISARKILVFPNGVDVEKFQPDSKDRRQIRTSLGIKDNPLVLFVGNFYKWHDVGIILDSFPQVLANFPDARLLLVGDGLLRQTMEERAIDLGMSHAVSFTGLIPHDDVPRYMASADISIVPYPRMDVENWLSPLKLFEYMASENAIIASAVGQVAEIIQDEKNGLLVPAGDTAKMTESILRLITDADLRRRLGKQARDDVIRRYSWEQYLSNLENVFMDVVHHKVSGANENSVPI